MVLERILNDIKQEKNVMLLLVERKEIKCEHKEQVVNRPKNKPL